MGTGEVFGGWTARYASEPKGMRDGWVKILGDGAVMPRDLVFPIPGGPKGKSRYQRQVASVSEYLGLIEEHAPRADLWVGWSPANQYDVPGMDRVFGDIDSNDLENALMRARRYEEWCMADFGVQPPAIFTAGKGFHLHMTHDFVEATGTTYSDAFASLIQGSGASPDLHVLKYRTTYPRVPYSMNLKATGIHRRPMYTVPVDLTWSLKEILQASAEINVLPFRVPHSSILGDLMLTEVEKLKKHQERMAQRPLEAQQGIFENLVQAAIIFSEEVGWRLVDSAGKPDGRRRVLSALYIPALMVDTHGDKDQVLAACESFVVMGGGNWPDYRRFVEGAIKDCVRRDSTLRSPVGLQRFWMENPELRVGKVIFRKN